MKSSLPAIRKMIILAPAPTDEALQTALHKIITRSTQAAHPAGVLVEEEGSTYMADNDGDSDEARVLRLRRGLARRAGDATAQLFQRLAVLCTAAHSGVQAETVNVGAQRLLEVCLPGHGALHRQHLLAGARAEGDAISTRRGLQRPERAVWASSESASLSAR